MQPSGFRPGGGKDGFGDRFILPIPPYPDHWGLATISDGEGSGAEEAECCSWLLGCVAKNWRSENLSKEVDYATTPKIWCMHWTGWWTVATPFTCPFRIIFIISYPLNVRLAVLNEPNSISGLVSLLSPYGLVWPCYWDTCSVRIQFLQLLFSYKFIYSFE